METLTNVGLIECTSTHGDPKGSAFDNRNGFRLKKVMVQDASPEMVQMLYPQSEVVLNKKAITEDETIDLIVIAGAGQENMDLVAEALQTGKHVRVV